MDLSTVADGFYYVGLYIDPNKDLSEDVATNNTVASEDELEIATADTTPPDEVDNLDAASGDTYIILSWTDPSDGDLNHLEITHDGEGGSTAVEVDPGDETETIDGLTNGTQYTFTVKTVDDSENVSNGEQISATPAASANTVPEVVNAQGITIDVGDTVALGTSELLTTDEDSSDDQIIYTILDVDGGIELLLQGSTIDVDDTFTQEDVNNDDLEVSDLDGTGGSYNIELSVQDDTGNFADDSPITITIDVDPPPPPTEVYVATTGSDATGTGHSVTPFATIQKGIDEAVGFGVSEVRVQEGVYEVDAPIQLAIGISVLGGYDFGWVRDPANSVTTIQDTSSPGGSEEDSSRAVEAPPGLDNSAVLDGFTVMGTSTAGSYTSAILIQSGSNPTISGNLIHGGEGSIQSSGIFINSADPQITGNDIHGGNNGSSHAVYLKSSNAKIESNRLYGGTGTDTHGAFVGASSSPQFINNNIHGGTGSSNSFGMTLIGTDATPTNPKIYNNTIAGGSGTRVNSYGIILDGIDGGVDPIIFNNIFFQLTGWTNAYGIFEAVTESDPVNLRNNNFSSGVVMYYDADTSSGHSTVAAVNAMGDIDVGDNLSVNPNFVDASGGDWHLASPSGASTGGLDLSAEGYNTDGDGIIRTDPWSMGAYELD